MEQNGDKTVTSPNIAWAGMNTLNGVKFVHEQIDPNTILPAAAKRPMNEIKEVTIFVQIILFEVSYKR